MRTFEQWNKKVIPLPDLKTFDSKKKEVSPFSNFHHWVADQCGGKPEGKQINVSASFLHDEDYDVISKIVKQWMKRCYKWNKAAVEYQFMWHDLSIGPSNKGSGDTLPDWLKPGFVYIDTDKLFKEDTHAGKENNG